MINTNRIVPITKIDLLTLIGFILGQTVEGLTKLEASSVDGDFVVADGSAPLLADQPLKTCDFGDGVSAATVYFVPSLAFEGFTAEGAAVTVSGSVEADGATLYKAVLATGTVTITKEFL